MLNPEYLAVFSGFGFFVNSSLHTFYVKNDRDVGVRFGLPYKREWGRHENVIYGYVGSVLLGVVAAGLFLFLSPILVTMFAEGSLRATVWSILGISLVLNLSQVIGGSSWTKMALDTALVIVSIFLILLLVYPVNITFWNLFPTYITLTFGLFTVGAEWINHVTRNHSVAPANFVEYKTEYSVSNGSTLADVNRRPNEPDQNLFLPFASIAYFAGAVGYLLLGSFVVMMVISGVSA